MPATARHLRPAMDHHKLDSIDLRILSELQANGRITNVELSRRAKIPAPACLWRIRALEKAGYIKGYPPWNTISSTPLTFAFFPNFRPMAESPMSNYRAARRFLRPLVYGAYALWRRQATSRATPHGTP